MTEQKKVGLIPHRPPQSKISQRNYGDPRGIPMWERTAARNTRTVGIRSILPLVLVVFVLALIGWFTR